MNDIDIKEKLKKFSDIESCPIRNIISRFSGKWSMLVLCILAEAPAVRFNTLGRSIPDISPKVLSETLKSLESDGLISRKVYPEVPPRVEYSMTDLGLSLMPHITSLIGWALDNFQLIFSNREMKLMGKGRK